MSTLHWSPTSPAVTAETIERTTQTHLITVVHFWAVWNPYDRLVDATLQALQPKFGNGIAFLSFDTTPEAGWMICRQYQVINLPSLVCFVKGIWRETVTGVQTEAELAAKFEGWQKGGP